MDTTILIGLAGQSTQFRLEVGAHARLSQYLDRAAARLHDDPDSAEVVGDLERSVGDRLASMVGTTDRVVSAADMDAILEDVGAVDTGGGESMGSGPGDPHARFDGSARPHKRRLQRVREGQQIAGVCTGIAAYSEIDVDWVRTVVILGTLVTGGILGLVYIALALILPIVPRHEVPR